MRSRGWVLRGPLIAAMVLPGARPANETHFSTFTIVARDAATGDLGVASCSRAEAVGAVVPWALSGVGAVATQAWTVPDLGQRALDLLGQGLPPRGALEWLLGDDSHPERRQIGIVAATGVSSTHTGRETLAFAGAIEGVDFTVLGNALVGRSTLEAMAESFQSSEAGGLTMPERLLRSLEAGQATGGDRRGGRSAALLVAPGPGGQGSGRALDLRVDDHDHPVAELRRIHDARAGRLGFRRLSRPEGRDVRELQQLLKRAGYYQREPDGVFDDATVAAVQTFRKDRGMYSGGQGGEIGLVDADLIARLRAFLEPQRAQPGKAKP